MLRIANLGCAIAWLVMGALAILNHVPILLLFLLPAAASVLRQLTSRVEVFESYLMVRNPIRTTRLSFDDIAQFAVTPSRIGAPFVWVVRATLRSGSSITLQGSKNDRLGAEDVWAALQSRIG